jgi:hypothetical protein
VPQRQRDKLGGRSSALNRYLQRFGDKRYRQRVSRASIICGSLERHMNNNNFTLGDVPTRLAPLSNTRKAAVLHTLDTHSTLANTEGGR